MPSDQNGQNTPKGHQARITDTILRDSHQSLLATRMRTEDMLPAAKMLDRVGYWSLEVWGGATFDACLRFLAAAFPDFRVRREGKTLQGWRWVHFGSQGFSLPCCR